ncbi:MAG: hypothetical protein AABZ46_07550 [Nitrospirota bacterium]
MNWATTIDDATLQDKDVVAGYPLRPKANAMGGIGLKGIFRRK